MCQRGMRLGGYLVIKTKKMGIHPRQPVSGNGQRHQRIGLFADKAPPLIGIDDSERPVQQATSAIAGLQRHIALKHPQQGECVLLLVSLMTDILNDHGKVTDLLRRHPILLRQKITVSFLS